MDEGLDPLTPSATTHQNVLGERCDLQPVFRADANKLLDTALWRCFVLL